MCPNWTALLVSLPPVNLYRLELCQLTSLVPFNSCLSELTIRSELFSDRAEHNRMSCKSSRSVCCTSDPQTSPLPASVTIFYCGKGSLTSQRKPKFTHKGHFFIFFYLILYSLPLILLYISFVYYFIHFYFSYGYGLGGRGVGVRVPVGERFISYVVQTGSGGPPSLLSNRLPGDAFPGDKADGARN
jgi:hypothetical protein